MKKFILGLVFAVMAIGVTVAVTHYAADSARVCAYPDHD